MKSFIYKQTVTSCADCPDKELSRYSAKRSYCVSGIKFNLDTVPDGCPYMLIKNEGKEIKKEI